MISRLQGALVVLAALVAVGCQDGGGSSQGTSGQPAYQKWNSEGDRVLVRDASGKPRYKLRVRSTSLKVYDRDFRALGYVEIPLETPSGGTDSSDESAEADAGQKDATFEIRVRRLGSGQAEALGKIKRDVWGIDGGARIERTSEGWAVFDQKARWIGQFEWSKQGGWQLQRGRDEPVVWRVEQRDDQFAVLAGGERRLTAPKDDLEPETLLALALEELPLLERVAVGHWLSRLKAD